MVLRNVLPGPGAAVSPGDLLEMYILKPDLLNRKLWVGPSNSRFKQPSGGCWCLHGFENHDRSTVIESSGCGLWSQAARIQIVSPPFSSCRVSYLNLVGLISKRGVIRVLAGFLGGLNESLCGKHLAQCLASSRHCINYLFAGMSLMAQGLGSIPGQGSSTHHVVRLPPPQKKNICCCCC